MNLTPENIRELILSTIDDKSGTSKQIQTKKYKKYYNTFREYAMKNGFSKHLHLLNEYILLRIFVYKLRYIDVFCSCGKLLRVPGKTKFCSNTCEIQHYKNLDDEILPLQDFITICKEKLQTTDRISSTTFIFEYKNNILFHTKQFNTLNLSSSNRIQCLVNNITSIPSCKYCGEEISKFNGTKFAETCGKKICTNKLNKEQTSQLQITTDKAKELLLRNGNTLKNDNFLLLPYVQSILECSSYLDNHNIFNRYISWKERLCYIIKQDKFILCKHCNSLLQFNIKTLSYMHSKGCNKSCPQIISNQKNTWFLKYGEVHPTHNYEIFLKTQKKQNTNKQYTLPSGKEITVQGYEHYALDILLTRFDEHEIDIHPKICIRYEDEFGVTRKYYPDFIINDTIIEVKSEYTMNAELNINYRKQLASQQAGYYHKFFILDKEKIILDIC